MFGMPQQRCLSPIPKIERLNGCIRYGGEGDSDDENNEPAHSERQWHSLYLNRYVKCFNVRLCDDILSDVFALGIRTELAKLEVEGVRFEHLIRSRFKHSPFLFFDIHFTDASERMKKNGDEKVIYAASILQPFNSSSSQMRFALDADFSVPTFMRFRYATIFLDLPYPGCPSMEDMDFRDWFQSQTCLFSQFAPAFVGCSLKFKINDTFCTNSFDGNELQSEHGKMVTFVQEVIPKYFPHCGRYNFDSNIEFRDYINTSINDEQIDCAGLLKSDPVQRCAVVKIKHRNLRDFVMTSMIPDDVDPWALRAQILPIKEIISWLHRPLEKEIKFGGRKYWAKGKVKRVLSISMNLIENFMELMETLKKEFQTAKQPAHQPYILKIKIYDPEKRIEIPDENVVNKKTSEKFSVICEHIPKHHFTTYITFVALTIRRAGVSIL